MCVEGMVTPRQRRWRIGRAFCQRASPSPFSLEDPADTADSYACWTDENADEAAVGPDGASAPKADGQAGILVGTSPFRETHLIDLARQALAGRGLYWVRVTPRSWKAFVWMGVGRAVMVKGVFRR